MVYGFQPEPLFDLAADVERYPEFLKWWVAAKILRRNANTYFAEQILGLGPIQFNFVSKTILYRPERIVVTADDPSFRRFERGSSNPARPGQHRQPGRKAGTPNVFTRDLKELISLALEGAHPGGPVEYLKGLASGEIRAPSFALVTRPSRVSTAPSPAGLTQ